MVECFLQSCQGADVRLDVAVEGAGDGGNRTAVLSPAAARPERPAVRGGALLLSNVVDAAERQSA